MPLTKPKTLTLEFVNNGQVQLPYIPSLLTFTDQAQHTTIPTTDGAVTFVAPKNSHRRDITVGAYMTVLKPVSSDAGESAKQAVLISTAIGVLNAGAPQVMQVINAIKSTVALGAGVYDTVTGLIGPPGSLGKFNNDAREVDKIISTLSVAMRDGDICFPQWDMESNANPSSDRGYIINQLRVDAARINDDGVTMEMNMTIHLVEVGAVVVTNG